MDMDFNIDIFINFHDRSRFICLITLFLNKGDIRPHFIPPSPLSHPPPSSYRNEKSWIYYWLSVQPHLRVLSRKVRNRYMQNILMLTD